MNRTDLKLATSNMLLIPSGPFTMGSDEGGEFEYPVHEVSLSSYLIDAAPVTNRQFTIFCQGTGYITDAEVQGQALGYLNGRYGFFAGLSWRNYASPDRAEHPVVLVSWNDANEYAIWAGKSLPTEAQWEKAARGTLQGALYPWGNSEPDGSQSPFARSPQKLPPTSPVKQYQPNGYGVFDMVGNVWQWCADWYSDTSYQNGAPYNPLGPDSGIYRVRRGGGWNVLQGFRLRSSNRGAMNPSASSTNLGFRCVMPVQ